MEPRDVKNGQQARQIVEERGLSHVKVGVFDMDGVMRGKYMARDKFFSALESGFGFCDVVLGWDVKDRLYDNVAYTGWHTGYPDVTVRVLPESCRELPLEGDMLFFLGEFSGATEAVCPRALLRRASGCLPASSMNFLSSMKPRTVSAPSNIKTWSPWRRRNSAIP